MGSNHSSERVKKELKPFTEHQLSVADIETKEWRSMIHRLRN